MKIGKSLLAGLLMIMTAMLPVAAEGGSLARAAFREATKSTSRAFRGAAAKTLRRDLLRDRATRVRLISRNRTVFRYTTKAQARRELRKGVLPGRHMTSRATPGRPLSPGQAQRRYGLPRRSQVRETIRLPRGQPVRFNRAVGGVPGMGTTTSAARRFGC
jgi:hypothetical protein